LRFYETVALVALLVLSFTLGVLSRIGFTTPYQGMLFVFLATFVGALTRVLWGAIERGDIRYGEKVILRLGRGLPPHVMKVRMLILEVSLLGIVGLVSYILTVRPRLNPLIGLTMIGLAASAVVSLFLTRIVGSSLISSRKTNAEVELPFLLAFMKVLSATHLTFYELLDIISESEALKWWSREIRFAKKLSRMMNISLVNALEMMASAHPSKTVKEMFTRLAVAGSMIGEVREVVDRVFSYVYDRLTQRIASLVDRLDILNGMILFGFMFMPILLATISPIARMQPIGILGLTLVFEVPLAILVYTLITAIYPSGFAVKPGSSLVLLGVASVLIIAVAGAVYLAPVVTAPPTKTDVQPGIPIELFFVIVAAALVPTTVLSELLYRQVETYSSLIKLSTDVAEVSASLGENFVTLLQEKAHQYGERVQRLARNIVAGYTSSYLRRALTSRAPTIFHASFVEMLMYAILLGAPYTALKSMMETYEALLKIYDRAKSVSRTLEGMIVSLAGMMGFFIEYLAKTFASFAKTVSEAVQAAGTVQIPPMVRSFMVSTGVYTTVSVATLISILIVALLTGKTRGGTVVFGFRTALLAFLAYAAATMIVRLFAPSPV